MDEQKKEITAAVGSRIKYFRHINSLSQEDLALHAGLNPAYLGQVERGLKCPTVDTLYKIAKALDVHPAELLKTAPVVDYPENHSQRLNELFSKVPNNKAEQVFKILENIVNLL